MVSITRGFVRELLKFHATFSLAAVGGGEIPKSFAGFTGYAVKGERGGGVVCSKTTCCSTSLRHIPAASQ